ncbi:hypothetical protein J7T55_003941 [Diaporthe amygdali]|uniref:uncharacterized protein n=1 Tax=Phomopsis amygdali TaxID=1214568 RepID=UPI0022FE414B|nr:uncharacterized protein J7T55_003941 [Diaporthe amygdali]KAJ0117524.1 hypothetical protein J7T55_003941 [Diaporthe amygdali]
MSEGLQVVAFIAENTFRYLVRSVFNEAAGAIASHQGIEAQIIGVLCPEELTNQQMAIYQLKDSGRCFHWSARVRSPSEVMTPSTKIPTPVRFALPIWSFPIYDNK